MLDKQKKIDTTIEKLDDQQKRRQFLNTFGKLALVTPVAVTTLISPETSAAPKSCRGNGSKRCR